MNIIGFAKWYWPNNFSYLDSFKKKGDLQIYIFKRLPMIFRNSKLCCQQNFPFAKVENTMFFQIMMLKNGPIFERKIVHTDFKLVSQR